MRQYQVLVVPNAACLTDLAINNLLEFAKNGGVIVATYESGIYDEMGERRDTPAFDALFGGSYQSPLHDLKSSYGQIKDPKHPIFKGIQNTDLIPNDGSIIQFKSHQEVNSVLTLIPPITAHSGATISIPEYSGNFTTTEIPLYVSHSFGAGVGILFCNQMDTLFYRYGFPDLGKLLANAVLIGLCNKRDLEVDAADFIDVTSMEQTNRRLIHLINFPVSKSISSGWRHPGGNLITQLDIPVRVKEPEGKKIKEVRLASSESNIPFQKNVDWVEVIVPSVKDHEIVVFEWE
jgi:hypothetical protein